MQLNVLPTIRIGGSVRRRVPRKALVKWIEENARPGRKAVVVPTDSVLTSRW